MKNISVVFNNTLRLVGYFHNLSTSASCVTHAESGQAVIGFTRLSTDLGLMPPWPGMEIALRGIAVCS